MRNLLKSFDLDKLAEKFMEKVDVEAIAREVMSNLIIKDIDMHFVVEKWDGEDGYNFLGMAYSVEAARKLADYEDAGKERVKIIRFDMGKLVTLIEKLGGTEVCEREDNV